MIIKMGTFKAIIGAGISALFAVLLLGMSFGLSYASTSSNTISASANILGVCYISLSPNTIAFGGSGTTPGITTAANSITDTDQNGNIAANVLLYASDWTGPSPSASYAFSGTYTGWNALSTGTFGAVPNSIGSAVNTGITIAAPTVTNPSTSNNIYFDLSVPNALTPGVYSQTITIENSC